MGYLNVSAAEINFHGWVGVGGGGGGWVVVVITRFKAKSQFKLD